MLFPNWLIVKHYANSQTLRAFCNSHLVHFLCEEDEYPEEAGEEHEDAEAREGWVLGEVGEDGLNLRYYTL